MPSRQAFSPLSIVRTYRAAVWTARRLRRKTGGGITAAQRGDIRACATDRGAEGFEHFCLTFLRIDDRAQRRVVPFRWFSGQRRVAGDLVAGRWLILLKGRQVGMTWLLAAYVLWRLLFEKRYLAIIINQERQYAHDFVERLLFMYYRLPTYLQRRIAIQNKSRLKLASRSGMTEIRAIVGGGKAARSMTGDLVVIDESSRVRELDKTMAAVAPAVEVAGGQIVQLSSSAGPQGFFYQCWQESYGTHGELLNLEGIGPSGFKPIFIHWSERDGRDSAWYEREKAKLDKVSPVAVKQEYPNDPAEAWEYAKGRVYPLFTRERCIGEVVIPHHAERYRAIDWGQTDSPFVCLWLAHVKGPPGLIVSPQCPNTIREMLAYRWDEQRPNEPYDADDHCPDAIRYAIITYGLTGLVYVYRELYLPNSVAEGWSFLKEVTKIHEMSGWSLAPPEMKRKWIPQGRAAEQYKGSVADRAWPLMIREFCLQEIPLIGHKPIRGRKGDTGRQIDTPLREVQEGIRRVNLLIDGSETIDKVVQVTRMRAAVESAIGQRPTRPRATTSLREAALRDVARRLLRRRT